MIRRKFLCITIILSFLGISILCQNYDVNIQGEFGLQQFQVHGQSFPLQELYKTHLEEHDIIIINGNADFISQVAEEGWQGDGTASSPYLIDNLNISGSGTGDLINISNSDVYFQINNCFLMGGSRGIYFFNVRNSYICNNTIFNNNGSGIALYFSESTLVNNTLFNNGGNGIYLAVVDNYTVVNNTISYNNGFGIFLSHSDNGTLVNNKIYNNSYDGIHLSSADNGTLVSNIISNNSWHGIQLFHSSNGTLINNTIFSNDIGIKLDSSVNITLANNTVSNNRKEGILLSSSVNSPITYNDISNNGLHGVQLVSSNHSTISHNVISSNNGSGIHQDSSNTSSITNNTIFNNFEYGIHIDSSVNTTLISNTIFNNNNSIFLSVSSACSILDNLVYNNNYGLHLFFSSNNIILRNIIYNKIDYGIFFSSSGNNTVSDNYLIDQGFFMSGSQLGHFLQASVTNNLVNGNPLVYWGNEANGTVPNAAGQVVLINCTSVHVTGENLEKSSIGVFVAYSFNLSIYNNVFSSNNRYGLYFFASANSTISNNTFFNNDKSGIHLVFSDFTTVFNNTIYYNRYNGVSISASNYSTIVSNIISNNENGIHLSSSFRSTISNNFIFDNDYGIGLHNSGNNTIESNKLTDNGLFVFGDDVSYYIQEKVANNTINDKTLVYWQNVTDKTVPQGTAQVILFNCTNVKIIRQNLVNVNIGVFAIQCTNLTIRDSIISDNHEGIKIVDSIRTSIFKNIIINNRHNGIFLRSSHWNTIIDNIISYNDFNGLILVESNLNSISNNFILSNGINGIDLWISYRNFIFKNRIANNNKYGMYLNQSGDNMVEWNSFIGNSPDIVSQVYDQGNTYSQNLFSYNYWDDWAAPDVNADGIVDYHYSINGSSISYDQNPMTVPYIIESFALSKPIIIFPNGREDLGGIITIQWSASSGILSHDVFYNVYYSFDDGTTWIMLTGGLTTTYYIWNTTTLPDGSSYYIRILAFDSEGKMAFDISDRSFTIINSYSGMTLLKLLIALIILMGGAFIFILSCSTLRDIHHLNKIKSLSRDSFFGYFQNDLMNSIKRGKWVILAVCGAFVFSFMRAWLIDPVVVVADRYDWYAINMKWLLNNWAHEIDRIPIDFLQFRIVYPLLIAILSTLSSFDVILIGRLISIISFSISIFYLSKILERFKSLSQSPNKERILIVFILTPTMITNFVRLETDIFFLALSLFIIHKYMMFLAGELNNLQKANFFIAIGLLLFTREVGAVLILVFLLHKFLSVSQKCKLLIIIFSFILYLVSIRIDVLQELLFIFIWNATGYTPAYEIVYNNNFLVLIERFLERISDPEDINRTIEPLVLAFFPSVIFCFLGFIRFYRKENRVNRKKMMKNIITLYFITYFSLFVLFKVGRGLDRFWIPVLLFPLLFLPFTVDLKGLYLDFQKLINETLIFVKLMYFRIFHRQKYYLMRSLSGSHISSSFFNMMRNTFHLNDGSISLFPKSTFYFIVISQILFYVIRLILSLITAGILPVYQ